MSETGRCRNAGCILQESYLPFLSPCQFGFTTRVLSWNKFAQGEIPVALNSVCLVGDGATIRCCCKELRPSVLPPRGAWAGARSSRVHGAAAECLGDPPKNAFTQSLRKAPHWCPPHMGRPSHCWGHSRAPVLSGTLARGRARSYAIALKAEEVSWRRTCNRAAVAALIIPLQRRQL